MPAPPARFPFLLPRNGQQQETPALSGKAPPPRPASVRVPPNGANMALSDIAATLTRALPHQTCGACYALSQMTDDDAAILRSLMADRTVSITNLAHSLADDPESPTIERQALARHANGACSAREKLRA